MTFDSSDMRELAGRRLRYSIVASLLLHLLVLWPGVTHVLTRDVPSVLHATLKPPPQAQIEPVATAEPPPRAVAPAPTSAAPPPKPRQHVLEQAGRDSVPPLTAPVAPPLPQLPPPPATGASAAVVAPPSAAAPAGATGAASGALITEGNASGEAVDGLRGYRLAVATQARRFKRYPAQAMASGWAGSTEVRVEVASDGRPRTATVVRSSGHELLDRAALTMIDAGALRARLPESLRGKAFAVVLPVVFNLDEE
jgi:periplasmic protein TonB